MQASLPFWKGVILKYVLKKENGMKFVDWIVNMHGGINKMGIVTVVEA